MNNDTQNPYAKMKPAELCSELKNRDVTIEQLKSEKRALTKQIESLSARVLGFLKAQDKGGRLTKRITPYHPPNGGEN